MYKVVCTCTCVHASVITVYMSYSDQNVELYNRNTKKYRWTQKYFEYLLWLSVTNALCLRRHSVKSTRMLPFKRLIMEQLRSVVTGNVVRLTYLV